MFDKYLQYQQQRQRRKAEQLRQKLRYGLILFGIIGAALISVAAIEAAMPTKTAEVVHAEPVTEVPVEPVTDQQDRNEFEWSSKQAQYCLSINQAAGFKEPELTERYDACIDETADWSLEQFE